MEPPDLIAGSKKTRLVLYSCSVAPREIFLACRRRLPFAKLFHFSFSTAIVLIRLIIIHPVLSLSMISSIHTLCLAYELNSDAMATVLEHRIATSYRLVQRIRSIEKDTNNPAKAAIRNGLEKAAPSQPASQLWRDRQTPVPIKPPPRCRWKLSTTENASTWNRRPEQSETFSLRNANHTRETTKKQQQRFIYDSATYLFIHRCVRQPYICTYVSVELTVSSLNAGHRLAGSLSRVGLCLLLILLSYAWFLAVLISGKEINFQDEGYKLIN